MNNAWDYCHRCHIKKAGNCEGKDKNCHEATQDQLIEIRKELPPIAKAQSYNLETIIIIIKGEYLMLTMRREEDWLEIDALAKEVGLKRGYYKTKEDEKDYLKNIKKNRGSQKIICNVTKELR